MRNTGRKTSGAMCWNKPTRPFLLCAMALLLASAAFLASADMAPVVPLPADPAANLKLPPGFKANVFANLRGAAGDYFRGPRFMAFGPDGNLYLSLGQDNKVVMLPDANHDGRADDVVVIADRLNAPQGLAFVGDKLLVANQDGVVRLDKTGGRWSPRATSLIPNLPSGGHTLKTLRLGPDGYLYLNVGSSCNVCVEEDPLRATILRYTTEGKPAGYLPAVGLHAPSPVWATGLRNSEGFAWHPKTGAMYATNNGSDMRSDKKGAPPLDMLPPEHFNRIEPGRDYGWPYCWGDRHADSNFPGPAGVCERMQPPAMTFPSHAAPLGMTFLDKAALPGEYRGDALVALHGSWNRREPSGYKVVRVHFAEGKPVDVGDFASGWLNAKGAWGRPVDVAVGADGAIYVSDDRAGMIYRIVYESPKL